MTLEEANKLPLIGKFVCMCGDEFQVPLMGKQKDNKYIWEFTEVNCTACGLNCNDLLYCMITLDQSKETKMSHRKVIGHLLLLRDQFFNEQKEGPYTAKIPNSVDLTKLYEVVADPKGKTLSDRIKAIGDSNPRTHISAVVSHDSNKIELVQSN